MTDILYIVGNGSRWDNNELRYSLRSIAKNGRNVGRVFLVGYKPDWVSEEVIHIPCDDPYDRKHKNILRKVVCAMERSDIGAHFLISSDDHYYVKVTDFDKLPLYYRYTDIPDKVIGRQIWSDYCKSLKDTRWLLKKYGLTTYQTNPHCNTHWVREVYAEHKDIFAKCMELEYGGEMNCVMGNLLIAQGWEPVQFHDAKLGKGDDVSEAVRQTECLSSTDNMSESRLAEYLKKKFNTKCKYER